MDKLETIFENENIMVVDKPAGILVYRPHIGMDEETVHSILKERVDYLREGERAGVVHRLDRDTSGLLIIAKNKRSEQALKGIFKRREIKKVYLALVSGIISPEEGIINIPLGRAPKDRLRVVPSAAGKISLTEYKTRTQYKKSRMSLLEIVLKTGRTHQIRVHLGAIGHPVIGDVRYGRQNSELSRQFLHASELELRDPFSGEIIRVISKLPEDLNNFLKKLS